jgi:Rieske Fe-S protein
LSAHHDDSPQQPPPSLWPVGFAIGIVLVIAGLVLSWLVAAVGAVIAAVFAFLWVRDLSTEPTPRVEPATVEVGEATAQSAAAPAVEPGAVAFPRSKFLEGATIAVGGVIGGIVTVPALGFAVLPSFVDTEDYEVNLGPIDNFPLDRFVIATYLEDPEAGEVSRRTVYVRNNGQVDGQPSFTILFSRCVHLGCPVQPSGPTQGEPKEVNGVQLQEVLPAGFGCPCHGGSYDNEGNRTAGPPVRALDRFEFSVRNGELWLGKPYSVSKVVGTGADARIRKYAHATPGVHVDGPEAWLYPISVS